MWFHTSKPRMSSNTSIKPRVVVTGVGALSSLGHNAEEFWTNLVAGKSGIKTLVGERFQNKLEFDFPCKIASFVSEDFKIDTNLLDEKEQRRFDTFTHFALHSTQEALRNAKLEVGSSYSPEEVGCILGIGMGGFPYLEDEHHKFTLGKRGRTSPFMIPAIIPNMATGMIGIKFGIKGINYSISSACASSGHALEAGYLQLISGNQKAMIVGGAEAVLTKFTNSGFASMKALSKREVDPSEASCPFSSDRDGFVMGEGAGILVLETLENAEKRGAPILAEFVGNGSSCDAFHITAPHEEGRGAVQSMTKALQNADINPEDIDYINAHGTSTPLGDKIETRAIKTVFKEHAYNLNVSSTKSMVGHLLGAAAGIESVACVLALKNQMVPPTINLNNPDPECDLNYTPNKAESKPLKYALNNAFGFGGTNSSLIFKTYQ